MEAERKRKDNEWRSETQHKRKHDDSDGGDHGDREVARRQRARWANPAREHGQDRQSRQRAGGAGHGTERKPLQGWPRRWARAPRSRRGRGAPGAETAARRMRQVRRAPGHAQEASTSGYIYYIMRDRVLPAFDCEQSHVDVLRGMYQNEENASSIPWKGTRTGGGLGEGPGRPCALEPTRSDSQFLHRSSGATARQGRIG